MASSGEESERIERRGWNERIERRGERVLMRGWVSQQLPTFGRAREPAHPRRAARDVARHLAHAWCIDRPDSRVTPRALEFHARRGDDGTEETSFVVRESIDDVVRTVDDRRERMPATASTEARADGSRQPKNQTPEPRRVGRGRHDAVEEMRKGGGVSRRTPRDDDARATK